MMLNFNDYNIPEHTQDALNRYVEFGFQPGGFLTAVLCNDLFGAVGNADRANLAALTDIVKFVYNEMPSNAWGNKQTVQAFAEKTWQASRVDLEDITE